MILKRQVGCIVFICLLGSSVFAEQRYEQFRKRCGKIGKNIKGFAQRKKGRAIIVALVVLAGGAAATICWYANRHRELHMDDIDPNGNDDSGDNPNPSRFDSEDSCHSDIECGDDYDPKQNALDYVRAFEKTLEDEMFDVVLGEIQKEMSVKCVYDSESGVVVMQLSPAYDQLGKETREAYEQKKEQYFEKLQMDFASTSIKRMDVRFGTVGKDGKFVLIDQKSIELVDNS